jgi:hypothetical protein
MSSIVLITNSFIEWFIGIALGIFVVYLAIRLWSSAFFRSKREYDIWKQTHPDLALRDLISWLKKTRQEN